VVVDAGDDITPGACPQCAARYEGGEGSAPDAVRAAVAAFGATDLDPVAVTDAVFRLTPAQSAEQGVAITSDERDDFYRWWLFVRPDASGDVIRVIEGVATAE
jgi:hypothetical protein